MENLNLSFGLSLGDLYEQSGLTEIDREFLSFLSDTSPALADRLKAARSAPDELSRLETSGLILSLVPYLEAFMGELFAIKSLLEQESQDHLDFDAFVLCRRKFIQRKALKAFTAEEALSFDGAALEKALGGPFDDLSFAKKVLGWLEDEDANAEMLERATRFSAWVYHSGARPDSRLFWQAGKKDYDQLVASGRPVESGYALDAPHLKERDGFNLTDQGCDRAFAMAEASYCVHCHERSRDSCARGLFVKQTEEIDKNPLGVELHGCPLEEMISEMHVAKLDGHMIGALAIACVDNPLLAGTGHRICNDCMNACIYQKQDPVEIPQVETRVLKDVLALPWGFEIYSLLTRWNPLNIKRPFPKEETGRRVLVVGLGPAGYTLAHHLMNDGHQVIGIDGLKIEPLPSDISGVDEGGNPVSFQPIFDVETLYERLGSRVMAGFGGVAEYGITVRWDKNFLKIIRLLLERRRQFAMFGGVRFGGTITPNDAFELGFDHIALCAGAGAPTVLDIPNNLAPGVRQASDLLMGLQLSGAARPDSVANLQVRLPCVVVGGGLTAIDTATECLAYYPVQVEKFLSRYETLCKEQGEETVCRGWSAEESEIAKEFISHAQAIREEKEKAARENRPADIIKLLRGWGGATIAYRRRLKDAPSYRLNADEVNHALREGIVIRELLSPKAVEVDCYGHAAALKVEVQRIDENTGRLTATGEFFDLPARSILVAAGTRPNTVLAREFPNMGLVLDGKYYRALDEDAHPVKPEWSPKSSKPYVLCHMEDPARALSYFGDLHPSYAGNVVSAMASAKQGYPVISRLLDKTEPQEIDPERFRDILNGLWRARVRDVVRLTRNIVEVTIDAPAAAENFRPGQFYRLQNFESHALKGEDGTLLAMEGLALTGATVDRTQGVLSTIVLEMGGSSNLCAHLKEGEPVVLMGPTGSPTEIVSDETVVLAGGGLGNAVLFSIGQALREQGSRVIYFAAYKTLEDRYHVDNIERAADCIIWCCDEAPGFVATRPTDFSFTGNVVEAMEAFAKGDLGPVPYRLDSAKRLIAIGSDKMMNALAKARHDRLKPYLNPLHIAIGSINSPMQCMMKEICAQCLQKHIDPITGKESIVFSCFNQDQELDRVSFDCLNDRLMQNSLQEKLTKLWIARTLDTIM